MLTYAANGVLQGLEQELWWGRREPHCLPVVAAALCWAFHKPYTSACMLPCR